MAGDAIAVLDALGVARAHVLGVSMGGMIVQRLAIDHPDRLLSMTSVMSRTGEPEYGQSTPDALAFLTRKPAASRAEYIDTQVAALHVYGSKPEWLDEAEIRARAGAAYDRCFYPAGFARQMQAIMADGSRAEALRAVRVPDARDARQPRPPHRTERRSPHGGGDSRRALRRDRRHGPRLSPRGVGHVDRHVGRLRARDRVNPKASPSTSLAGRVDRLPWPDATHALDDLGCTLAGTVLDEHECRDLVDLYPDDTRFRATIDMARHRFGEGQYRYFAPPLPEIVTELRAAFWPHLLPIARLGRTAGRPAPWPDRLDDWLEQCHAAGQTRSTPLMLRYGPGDWNALHRDLYGDLVFPLQVVIGLDAPGVDYTGAEFVVVEQRPRAQSRATALGHRPRRRARVHDA